MKLITPLTAFIPPKIPSESRPGETDCAFKISTIRAICARKRYRIVKKKSYGNTGWRLK